MGALSFATRRRDLATLVRRFYSLAGLSGHSCQMGQFERVPAAGGVYVRGEIGVHGASLFFLPFGAYPNGSELFGGLWYER